MEARAASAAAEQIQAYVQYLRDLGVYDLYLRPDPQTVLPEAVRDALLEEATRRTSLPAGRPAALAAHPGAARTPAAPNTSTVPGKASVSAPARSPAPSPPNAVRTAAPLIARPAAIAVPPSESRNYFDIEPATPGLPQELAAPMPKPVAFDQLAPIPVQIVAPADRPAALATVRAEIGDCTRCPLAYAGRHNIVFADGDPNARLMFVGEGPGADEDASGLPFVGKAGQLLNNMISAMGVKREEVYIANIVKCRPPGNRTPEFVEATTCSQFLVKQIDIVRPQVIVALGSTAATYLLGVRQSLSSLRGRWHASRGSKVLVTYHPAFLLRDPRQKGEAWKDLQMAMLELGLKGQTAKT